MMQLRKSKPQPTIDQFESQINQIEFQATGTRWRITVKADIADSRLLEVKNNIVALTNDFEEQYSRFRPTSLVSKLQNSTGNFLFPDNFTKLWKLYQKLSELSGGLFTPFIGSLLVEAGYDPSYSLETKQLNTPPGWDAVTYQHPYLQTNTPVTLDFGAAGKGYLVDIVAQSLSTMGLTDFLIDAGGDIKQVTATAKPAEIGLEHPLNSNQVIGVAHISNQSLCGSSGNRRHWNQFHHIINPHTKTSPMNILATWVVAETALEADALATCLFFAPPTTFSKTFNFSYALVNADQSLSYSSNFPATFF